MNSPYLVGLYCGACGKRLGLDETEWRRDIYGQPVSPICRDAQACVTRMNIRAASIHHFPQIPWPDFMDLRPGQNWPGVHQWLEESADRRIPRDAAANERG